MVVLELNLPLSSVPEGSVAPFSHTQGLCSTGGVPLRFGRGKVWVRGQIPSNQLKKLVSDPAVRSVQEVFDPNHFGTDLLD